MDITPAPTKEQHLIQSYGAGRFVVREQEIAENILVWPTGVELMGRSSLEELSSSRRRPGPRATNESTQSDALDPSLRRDDDLFNLANLISPLPELLIIGTGQWMLPAPVELKEHMKAQNITVEPMDTGAACRTYNVLVSEDRRVAAYLIAV